MTLIQQTDEVERHILCEKHHKCPNTINNTMSDTNIEYNDFGFTAMDADELASVDTKIVETTT